MLTIYYQWEHWALEARSRDHVSQSSPYIWDLYTDLSIVVPWNLRRLVI